MKKLFASCAFLFLSATAYASPCIPGTLQDYIDLSPDGCTVNGLLFQNFELAELPFGATEVDPNAIQVTPTGGSSAATLLLTLDISAGPGVLRESIFRFNAIGTPSGASIALGNPLVAGDGAVTGILDVCAGGEFLGVEPIGCTGTPETAIAFATIFDSSLKESVSLPGSSFFDVFVDFAVDGGLGGFASLDSAA